MTDIMWIVPGRFQEALDCPEDGDFMQSCLTAYIAGLQANELQPDDIDDQEYASGVVNLIETGLMEMGVEVQDHATVVYMASPLSDAEPQPIAELKHATEH